MYCVNPDTFIPLRLTECGELNPTDSGYYADDLPSVTLYSLGKTLNLEYYLQTKQFITDKVAASVLDAKKDIMQAFNSQNKYSFLSNIRYSQTDTKSQDYTAHIFQSTNNDRYGVEIFRHWAGEAMTKASIDYIDIDFGNAGDYILYVEELNQTTQYPFTGIANQTVRVKLQYLIKNWSYNYFSTTSHNDSVKIYIINPATGTTFMQNQSSHYNCGRNCMNSDYFSVNGYTNTQIPNSINEMYGFNVSVSLQCDFDGLFCSILPYTTDLIYYRLAYYIYLEACYTNRLNSITLDKAKIKELLAWAKDEYKASLDALVLSGDFVKTIKSECIRCNSSNQYFSI